MLKSVKPSNRKNGTGLVQTSNLHFAGQSQSPTNKPVAKKEFNHLREKQLINSSRVVNMNAASKSLAPPSKLSTMDNFHRQPKGGIFIRQSFNNSKMGD